MTLFYINLAPLFLMKMDLERCQRRTTYEGCVLMGYLGVYIWRRSTILDMMLGGMLEELSSVKPMTGLGLIG